jgi:LemA protein
MKEDSASDAKKQSGPEYSAAEAEEIYKRAAEMHAETLFEEPDDKLTEGEIEGNAERAGINEKFVERAIAERAEEQRQQTLKREQLAALRRTWGRRVGIAAALLAVTTGVFGWNTRAKLNHYEVQVETAQAQVENVIERRHELVPALIEMTKSSRARDQALADALNAANERAKSAAPAERETSEAQLGREIRRTLDAVEADNRGNELAFRLADQIEGASNRISVERKKYNEAVGQYNEQAGKTPSFMLKVLGYPRRYEVVKARE